jgi:hypothetical protein
VNTHYTKSCRALRQENNARLPALLPLFAFVISARTHNFSFFTAPGLMLPAAPSKSRRS